MAGVGNRRWIDLVGDCSLWAPVLLVALAVGCKSGTWGAKPSWWSFGGTPPASELTAAPAFDKEVTKPSEAAKPYPTTETPEAYSLAETPRKDAAAATPVIEPASVTYGTTQPMTPTAPPLAQVPAADAQGERIGPQVGRYAGLQPTGPAAADAASAVTAGLAAAPDFGEAPPPAAGAEGIRVADARGSESWAAQPAAPPADLRYGQASGSRFPNTPPPASLEPAPAVERTAVLPPPPVAPAAVPAPPPASPIAFPPLPPAVPSAVPLLPPPAAPVPASPPAAADVLPGAIQPPQRRPDPGYRPGGTANYRAGGTILAGDQPTGGVERAAFQAEPPIR
ncbi:MAG: hypothetical protein FJ284_13415 [Planctomycetes bacterium]|nr:hypothetical protein [Planctomycetota bacterium]